jgi:hypothetical protein
MFLLDCAAAPKISGQSIATRSPAVGAVSVRRSASAFRRRFAYDVQFAFPSVELREELWKRAFPRKASTFELDYQDLAERCDLSGGYIKVAAERAAFIAAGRQQPIKMATLIDTVERMYRERGKLSPVGRLE